MKYSEYKRLVLSDLYRLTDNLSFRSLLDNIHSNDGFEYVFWMRTFNYTKGVWFLRYTAHQVVKIMMRRLKYKLGISIPPETIIGPGFYIGHFGGIVINKAAILGRNVNISQGVTVGQANRGKRRGNPIVGDNVYIGPGAKIIGAIRVGNNVAIGANAVIVNDVPDNSVAVGVPGRVISSGGAAGYVNRIDYENKI